MPIFILVIVIAVCGLGSLFCLLGSFLEGNANYRTRYRVILPFILLLSVLVGGWLQMSASQDYKVASIKICTTKAEGDKNYIEYASQRNKYTKVYVGNAPFYRVVEYEQSYYGILYEIKPDIVPGTMEELMLPKPQKEDLQTDIQKFMRVPLDKAAA